MIEKIKKNYFYRQGNDVVTAEVFVENNLYYMKFDNGRYQHTFPVCCVSDSIPDCVVNIHARWMFEEIAPTCIGIAYADFDYTIEIDPFEWWEEETGIGTCGAEFRP